MSGYHKINVSDLKEMESRPRAELVNSLLDKKGDHLAGIVLGTENIEHAKEVLKTLKNIGSSAIIWTSKHVFADSPMKSVARRCQMRQMLLDETKCCKTLPDAALTAQMLPGAVRASRCCH